MVSGEECKSPPTTFGTTHDGGDTLVFTTGQTIQYTCDFGHFAVGSTTRICQEGGVWTENDDICRLGEGAFLVFVCLWIFWGGFYKEYTSLISSYSSKPVPFIMYSSVLIQTKKSRIKINKVRLGLHHQISKQIAF